MRVQQNMHSNGIDTIKWVDCTKILACFFVVIGHLYMSLQESGWINKEAIYYCLPIQIVYSFHVQLFFVCSGFLYQKIKKEISFKSHLFNIKNKAIALGIPYFVFSIITLMLKYCFSNDVNSKATPFLKTLFIKPISPYWYLYVLFLLFLLIPRVGKKTSIVLIFITSLVAKILILLFPIKLPYMIYQVITWAIWFSLGMFLTVVKFKHSILEKLFFIVLGLSGITLSVKYFIYDQKNLSIHFLISVLLVLPILYFVILITGKGKGEYFSKYRKYILPIFLMHTIFAATTRTVLLKIGIQSIAIHIIAGLIASFVIPVIVYSLVERKWWLLIFIEPLKSIKMKNRRDG